MIKLALRGMAERRLRSALTGVAVLLGVAMIAGTYVLTDQIHAAFSDINRTANQGRDAVISQAGCSTSAPGVVVGQEPAEVINGLVELLARHRVWDRVC